MNPQMLIMLAVMVLAFWGLSRFSRSQQKKMLAEQERRTNEALVPGNWVRTRAGFYGTVVEVSGDVVTLATPLGDESLWAKASIVGAEEPPFATDPEGSEVEDGEAPDDGAGTRADEEGGDGAADSADAAGSAGSAGSTGAAPAADADDERSRA